MDYEDTANQSISDEEMESDDDLIPESEDDEDEERSKGRVYLPGCEIGEDYDSRPSKMVVDESVYIMLHKAHTGAPCLSFDILKDALGDKRESYPMTNYIVAGTQAERSHTNAVIVMKLSNMYRFKEAKVGEESEEESDDEEGADKSKAPVLSAATIKHPLGAVNRIRASSVGDVPVAASWCERGIVYIWNLKDPLAALSDSHMLSEHNKQSKTKPQHLLQEFNGHGVEGFAMDWSSVVQGQLLTGDCNKNIHLWRPHDDASWIVDQRSFVGHTASVEDIQWSPNEATVFASCSVDKSIRIWDIRVPPSKACMLTAPEAHERDVNVISWNTNEPFILSGGDDGLIKVWELRQFKTGKPVALFKHHTSAITSVAWHPTDGSVFGASGADNQITLWDLAVEQDDEAEQLDVPPQLLFIHQGQSDIKEIHWHKQCPGVMISTAHSGFNVFRTISV
ncbi:glutamate-rich WD repeat-containing protein 1-like [Watersipora subatra]|uniref:glutamate-rich WD repeat-containing protein 1-like n=1 Tax=Watersipora subatra TaxID=2589382 RepID=UPI00355AD307